jgi:hypothetical protein
MCKFESYSLIKSEIQNTQLGVYKRLALKTSKDGETMITNMFRWLSSCLRRKNEYGNDCINRLNLLETTRIPVRRNLRWGIKH